MNTFELLLLSVGLSMDAFAVAVCTGLTIKKGIHRKALIVGLYFGFFQAVMPLIGYLVAAFFAKQIVDYDHWIAFALLGFLGVKMIVDGFKKERHTESTYHKTTNIDQSSNKEEQQTHQETSLRPAAILPLALATSIDALAIGISFAFLQTSIVPAILVIGLITLLISTVGVILGQVFGTRFKSKAGLLGGIILILIGLKILLEHLNTYG